jgi:magnesium-protoporphyrin O-methyltransferase
MPPACCRPDYDALFDARAARRELHAYRRSGLSGTSRRLVDALRTAGVAGARVLDIGAGIGAVGLELLEAGAGSLVAVDASRPYAGVARAEIERRGVTERATVLHGDFVQLAEDIEPAEVVTLHRVICCYDDWQALVDRSLGRARRLYGLVYPVDRWWTRLVVGAGRLIGRLRGQALPFHVHPEGAVDARIRAAGWAPIVHERGLAWQTVVYQRMP